MQLYFCTAIQLKPVTASKKDKNKNKAKAKAKANANAKANAKAHFKQCPDPGNVNDTGNVYQPEGPPSFEKVWLMFQESDKKWQETDKRFRKTERIVRDVSKNIGGLNNTVGEVAEAYFRGAFSKLGELSGVKVKAVDSLQRTVGKLTGQFDIVVFGDTSNILVEVKHKLREKDVIHFCKKTFPTFKRLYPEHCNQKLFGAVAGMSIDDEALTQALDHGLLVFTQSGQTIELLNPEGFEPKEF